MSLSRCHNIEDLRREARRRLPKGLFEFIDRATEDDVALRRNRASLEAIRLAPRTLVDVSQRTTEATIFGRRYRMPLAVAPAGPAGLFWYDGEVAIARAAAAAGVPFTVSSYATTELSALAKAGCALWFQLYLWNDRSLSLKALDMARSNGVDVMFVTVDTPMVGQREYQKHNGFAAPFKVSARVLRDVAMHPRWLAGVALRLALARTWPHPVNLPADADAGRIMLSQSTTWDDIARIRDNWPGALVVKGILRPDDAIRAAALGADGVVVSNHGGRNLDSAVAPIAVLPHIVKAVGRRITVLMDSGVRRGSDIVKALALGAKAVLAGRPVLYGVAAAGEAGALHALQLLQSELDRTMGLTGCRTVNEIGGDLIFDERHWSEDSGLRLDTPAGMTPAASRLRSVEA